MKNTLVILLGTLLFIMSSCNDFFELERPQETQWTTTSTFEQGLSAAYWNLHWTGGMGRGCPQYFDFITSGSANLLDGVSVGVSYSQPYYRMFDQKLGESKETWSKGYMIITLANLALDLDRDGHGNPFNLDIKSDDYIHNYKRQIAEYHFLRGYTYFYLIKNFGTPYDPSGDNLSLSIPLKTTAAYSKEDVMNEKLGTVKDVYDLVLSDLQYAKDNLPEQYTLNSWNDVPGYDCGRGNKIVAASLLGKVYFLMGKYDLAKKEFDHVIDYAEQTGTYRLEKPEAPFIEEKAANRPLESIWEFNSGQLDGKSENHNMYAYYGMIMGLRFRDSNGSGFYNVTDSKDGVVMSSWNCFAVGYRTLKQMGWMADPENGDYSITPVAKSDLRYQQVYHLMLPYEKGIKKGDDKYITNESVDAHAQVATPHVYLDKFFRGEKPYGRYSKYPYIRLADLYLQRAWLRWNSGDMQGAVEDMNKVWNRSNPDELDKYNSSNVNHTSIFTEYLKEMTGEGWTVDFMMGKRMPIPAGDAEGNTIVNPPYSNWHWPIFSRLLLLFLALNSFSAFASPMYDLVIVGGNPGGIMAAISAARMGKNSVILERTRYIGVVEPDITSSTIFDGVLASLQGLYLLRTQPDVIPEKIGVVGVSWGGYLTTMVSGLASPLIAASFSVFGSGFYDASTVFLKELDRMEPVHKAIWLRWLDAGRRACTIQNPFFIAAATNDNWFYPQAVKNTLQYIRGSVNHVFSQNVNHKIALPGGTENKKAGSPGWTMMEEIYFDYYLKGKGKKFPKIQTIRLEKTGSYKVRVRFTVDSDTPIKQAEVNYSPVGETPVRRKWTTVPARRIQENQYEALIDIKDMKTTPVEFYGTVSDSRPVSVSSYMIWYPN